MTKKEMLNLMIEIGCIKAEDYNVWIRKSKETIKRVYDTAVPLRLAYLSK